VEEAGRLCSRCERAPPPFANAWSPYLHEGPLARAIHRFKYEDHPELAPLLARLLAPYAGKLVEKSHGELLAIPLHARRFAERRFDQAQLLTHALARALQREAAQGLLFRVRHTSRQVGLLERARVENLEGAFVASRAAAGRCFILVDDVLTTGATARAAAHALLEANAAQVTVLTLARAFTGTLSGDLRFYAAAVP
jgi:ComF family protein